MRSHKLLLFLFLLGSASAAAQTSFKYKRSISGVSQEGWYEVNLPPEMFSELNDSFSDIRIFSVRDGDSLEIPYLLDVQDDVVSHQTVVLTTVNKSYRDGSMFVTFEQRAGQKVNYLDLAFSENNYFAWVTLEGSDDRNKWFQIVRDQRIVSVRADQGDYTLSRINFPLTDYRFLRAEIRADIPLKFQKASFHYRDVQKGNFSQLPLQWNTRVEKKNKQSIIDIVLEHYVPVSSIEVKTDTSSDYYRPLRIEYVADSFKTDKGWMKRYETLYEGHLTSFRPNRFEFQWKPARELRLVVTNNDNQPIAISGMEVWGPRTRILTRLKPDDHIVLYGADLMRPPSYDLTYFENKIPDSLLTAALQPAEALTPESRSSPLFENQIWLWVIMIVVVAGLGIFTVKMMTEKREVNA